MTPFSLTWLRIHVIVDRRHQRLAYTVIWAAYEENLEFADPPRHKTTPVLT
jgi:hypothetical protein